MSLNVNVSITGDLDNIRNRDLAEHICKIINESIADTAAKVEGSSVSIGTPSENKKALEWRPLLGSEPFKPNGEDRDVTLYSYVHLPPPGEV